ncbi:MAG: CRISPR-associated endonuclease Cas2 [Patescibacteria group bacterium]
MKRRTTNDRRKITAEGMLRLLGDSLELMFPLTKLGAWKRAYRPKFLYLEDYFPSELGRTADRLQRRGLVEMSQEDGQWIVKLTEKGKVELLKYKLTDLRPGTGKWDGMWRMVFFDIPESRKGKRDVLRNYLRKLGMEQMQDSVYVGPYDVEKEVKLLREVLEIPDGVKLGVLKWIENEEELKEIFGLK